MPERSQVITAAGYSADKLQALALGALLELNWTIKYAIERNLVAYTQRNWKKYDDLVTVEAQDGQLVVTSKMIHNELVDLMGRNKKNIEQFISQFEAIKAKTTDTDIAGWKEKIAVLKEDTVKTVEQEAKQAQEIDTVMNFSKSNLYATYGIMAINVLVFVLMVVSGVDSFQPNAAEIIPWGANYGPLTLSGDWWRLITCAFVHIGIIHLAFNMYALYMAGVYLEPMLGKTRYIVAYLCTGVFSSLASLWWHKDPTASAGASGAIFGLYGLFLAFLTTKFLPPQIRKGLLQSIGIFVVYNLVYGIKAGVDNAGHVGGLLSGLVIGYLYYLSMKGDDPEKKKTLVMAAASILTIAVAFFYLQKNEAAPGTREKVKTELEFFTHKDADRFNETYNSIIEMQDKAMAPLRNDALTDEQLAEQLTNISVPEWEKADKAVKQLMGYNVPDKSKQKAEVMQQYITLRKEEVRLRLKWIADKDEATIKEINEVVDKLNDKVAELDRL